MQFLVDHLEEEFTEDSDYYIDQAAIEFLQEQGADAGLIQLLGQAIAKAGPDEGIDIAYKR